MVVYALIFSAMVQGQPWEGLRKRFRKFDDNRRAFLRLSEAFKKQQEEACPELWGDVNVRAFDALIASDFKSNPLSAHTPYIKGGMNNFTTP